MKWKERKMKDLNHNTSHHQWWASWFHKVVALLYFCYWKKRLATFNLLPIFHCNGSITVNSYWYFKCNKIITSFYKK
jgi:hypothetical protein